MAFKNDMDLNVLEGDARHRIIEAATYLFGMKGYDGTSTREIAARAGVNIASLNYYFKTKQNLLMEVMNSVIDGFKGKIKNIAIDSDLKAADFAVRMFHVIAEDGPKCLNQFKLVMDASHFSEEKLEPDPVGLEQISFYLKRELIHPIPEQEIVWAANVIFAHIHHLAIISNSILGKRFLEKHFAFISVETSITKLVETLVRDLNHKHS